MKRVFLFILSFVIVISSFVTYCFAAGEVAGNVYGSDIVTYIYNCPVTSYNIGGKTCIDAEILNWYYGFDVYWLADERKLTIDDKGGRFASGQAASGELVEKSSAKAGEIVGNYYHTDIVTYLNGKEITSYNIGGRTVILAEEMADHGYDVIWSEIERKLLIDKPVDFYKYKTEMGDIKTIYKYDSYIYFATECMANVVLIKDKNNYTEVMIEKTLPAVSDGMGNQYIKFADFADILGGKWTMNEELFTYEDADAMGVIYFGERYTYNFDFFFDNTKEIPTVARTSNPDLGPWPNQRGKMDVVILQDITNVNINGLNRPINSQNGGKVFGSHFMVYNDQLYIPVQMLADVTGYELATLSIVAYSVDK